MLDERWLWSGLAILFGLIVGSAINALVWRLYVGKSWVHGRSQCPDCGHVLAAKDLIPVLSWVLLGGRCRYCRKPIQDHPIVELVTGLLFGLSAWILAPATAWEWGVLAWWFVILAMLIILAVYDLRWMLLPDKVMVPLALVSAGYVTYLVVWAIMAGQSPQPIIVGSLCAAALGGGGFLALAVATRGRGMGGGDVKLAGVMGLVLGLQGLVSALLLAFYAAAVVGIGLIAMRRRSRKDYLPFGPFLVGGMIIAFWWGREIMTWYFQLNGWRG